MNVSWHLLHLKIDALSIIVRLFPGRVLANQRIVTDELFLTLRPTATTRIAWRSRSQGQFAVALDLMWRSDVVAVGVGRGPHAREGKKGGYDARHQRVDLCCAVHKVRQNAENSCHTGQHHSRRTRVLDALAWNEHCLTAHDKDYLHRPELLHTHGTALVDGVSQLGVEDGTEEEDAGHDADVRSGSQRGDQRPLLVGLSGDVDDAQVCVDDHGDEANRADGHCHDGGDCRDQKSPSCSQGHTHDANLKEQRKLQTSDDQEVDNFCGHGQSNGLIDVVIVAVHPVVEVVEGTMECHTHDDGADEQQDQGSEVEEENDAASLFGSGHEGKNEHQDDGDAQLDAIDDAGIDRSCLKLEDV